MKRTSHFILAILAATLVAGAAAQGPTPKVTSPSPSAWRTYLNLVPGTDIIPWVAPGTDGNVLTANGGAWTSAAPTGGPGGGANALGYYLVGRSTNAPTNAINLGGLAGSGFLTVSVAGGVASFGYDASTYLTTSAATSGYQPLDTDLTTIAGLSTATNGKVLKVTGNVWALGDDATGGLSAINAYSLLANNTASSAVPVGVTFTDLKTAMSLNNVTNESKATMFTSPAFTGTPTGITAAHVGLGNVTNESKATMFASPQLTGTIKLGTTSAANQVWTASGTDGTGGWAASQSGTTLNGTGYVLMAGSTPSYTTLASMFTNATFTGTFAIPANTLGLDDLPQQAADTFLGRDTAGTGNVETFTASAAKTMLALTAADVGLGNVTNESKATMFTSPAFTGTPTGITATHVGLGNVTNESKATMFTSPTFTGSVTMGGTTTDNFVWTASGTTGLGGWEASQSGTTLNGTGYVLMSGATPSYTTLADMFTNATFTGTFEVPAASLDLDDLPTMAANTFLARDTESTGAVEVVTAAAVKTMLALNNVTNESKATMFTSPAFTGTPTGITATHVGLGNVTNESKATMFTSPTFTGTPVIPDNSLQLADLPQMTADAFLGRDTTGTGNVESITASAAKAMLVLTASDVGLGNVTNESKATMFASPTFTGTVSGVTATHVGLGNVTNESKATMFTSPAFTGTPTGITATHVGLGNVTNESKVTMFTNPTFTGNVALPTTLKVGTSTTAGQHLVATGADGSAGWASQYATINYVIDGGGSAITTGDAGSIRIPWAGTIQSVTLLGDTTGSITVDILRSTYANFPGTMTSLASTGAKAAFSSAQKSEDATLTNWTKTLADGDILRFNVDSAATVTRVTVSIRVLKS